MLGLLSHEDTTTISTPVRWVLCMEMLEYLGDGGFLIVN
jgi:hypothetical protein